MPTYNYKCNDCNETFEVVHGIKSAWTTCSLCESEKIEKVVTSFLANTETSLEAKNRHYEEQAFKDVKRFYQDDKFAANVTGADDLKSEERKRKHLENELKKQKDKTKTIKQTGWNFSK